MANTEAPLNEGAGDPSGSTRDKGGRAWTTRFTPPIKYRRYTANNAAGFPFIFIKLEQPSSDDKLYPVVRDVIKELELLDGRTATGLKRIRDRDHGVVWRLADNPAGRTAADIIDAKLADLAERFRKESQAQL